MTMTLFPFFDALSDATKKLPGTRAKKAKPRICNAVKSCCSLSSLIRKIKPALTFQHDLNCLRSAML
jgi:hypothetical protein